MRVVLDAPTTMACTRGSTPTGRCCRRCYPPRMSFTIRDRHSGGRRRTRTTTEPRARDQDDGRMTTTTATLAVGGTTLKIDETVTSSRAAATVMALPNVSLAPPPARCRPISFARGGMRLGRCRLEAMLTTMTTATTVRLTMTTGGSERTNPL